jgi:hypothetical protein
VQGRPEDRSVASVASPVQIRVISAIAGVHSSAEVTVPLTVAR